MRDQTAKARLAIHDMLDNIANARSVASNMTFDAFVRSTLHRLAVERTIEIISEASRRISGDLKATEPEIPWSRIAGIGNVLRHDYDDVSSQVVWNAIENDLPVLEGALKRILAAIGDDE